MTIGKFKAAGAGAARPPVKKKSRYAGIKAAAPKDPIPHVGLYRLRVIEKEQGHNAGKGTDSYKTKFEIVELHDEDAAKHHNVGDVVIVFQLISGKAAVAGLPRVKSQVMAEAGYEDEDEYDAFDPDGLFIDATTGATNEYSEAGLTTIGRLVDCQVTRGNATPDGHDYYREYAWGVVPEEEQDTTPKAEFSQAAE
jgi:hypothetical protein